ncbi:hypothetical protein BWI15_05780 [Kribbella sp. ALI-6-A]|uniref:hypothetical protein n=1 Tax=Kribbella sp. ALI-6-A TaxID=1933817 RepID=UPI00097C9A30|nr:hypothetical protein [Kribbella sp. ALI-6-A]ONI76787.1 hypothetical protein BWI15_05780 [Kribbella sp. ALI-6-A]
MATNTGQRAGVEWAGRPDGDDAVEQPRIHVDQRVSHYDYGRGTVVLFHGPVLQVLWDKPLLDGTISRLMDHDAAFARHLVPLVTDPDGRETPAPRAAGRGV